MTEGKYQPPSHDAWIWAVRERESGTLVDVVVAQTAYEAVEKNGGHLSSHEAFYVIAYSEDYLLRWLEKSTEGLGPEDIKLLRTKCVELWAELHGSPVSTTSKEQPDTTSPEEDDALSVDEELLSTLSSTELVTVAATCCALLGTRPQGWASLWDLKSKLEALHSTVTNKDLWSLFGGSGAIRILSEAWLKQLRQSPRSES